MKIKEKDLRRVIKNVIRENYSDMMPLDMGSPIHMADDMPSQHDVGGMMHGNMEKASKCCHMSKEELLDMCKRICAQNASMARDCCELCYCASKGKEGIQDCCMCLDRICSCAACSQICSDCCGC